MQVRRQPDREGGIQNVPLSPNGGTGDDGEQEELAAAGEMIGAIVPVAIFWT